MFTLAFWKAAAERAVKTFAQSLVGVLTVAMGAASGLAGLDWGNVLQAALVAAGLSILTSLVSAPVGGNGPSLGTETLTPVVAAEKVTTYPNQANAQYVAGPAADVPEGTPVDVVAECPEFDEPVEFDGYGAPISNLEK